MEPSSSSNQFQNQVSSTASNVANKAQQAAGKAQRVVDQVKGQLSDNWTDNYQAVQGKAREAMSTSEEFMRSHPYYTVLGAATAGLVIGMLLNRRS